MTRALLMIFCLSSLALTSCVSGPIPKWEGKIWLGRQKAAGIIFTNSDGSNEIIRADDPRFNDYIAMTTDDLKSFLATYVFGCAKWKTNVQMMTPEKAYKSFGFLWEENIGEVKTGPNGSSPLQSVPQNKDAGSR
jgi:hypothetical protein